MKNWIKVADVAFEIKKHAAFMNIDTEKGSKQCQRDMDVAEYLMTRLSV